MTSGASRCLLPGPGSKDGHHPGAGFLGPKPGRCSSGVDELCQPTALAWKVFHATSKSRRYSQNMYFWKNICFL